MSEEAVQIPLPRPTPLSKPHWDGCRQGVLRFQRCTACGGAEFPPQSLCTQCQHKELEWVESSGRGTVYSMTTVHRPQRREFTVPYTVAIVELDEGWMMLSNLVDCEPERVQVGMPVQVAFARQSDEITLPYFPPALMPTQAEMKRVVEAYVAGLNTRDAEAVIALFAPDAEIEDPVGTPAKRGDTIAAWFRGAVQVEPHLEVVEPVRGSHGASAAMAFTVTTTRANGRFRTRSIDVFHFDEDGRIRRLEGYWGPEDRVAIEAALRS